MTSLAPITVNGLEGEYQFIRHNNDEHDKTLIFVNLTNSNAFLHSARRSISNVFINTMVQNNKAIIGDIYFLRDLYHQNYDITLSISRKFYSSSDYKEEVEDFSNIGSFNVLINSEKGGGKIYNYTRNGKYTVTNDTIWRLMYCTMYLGCINVAIKDVYTGDFNILISNKEDQIRLLKGLISTVTANESLVALLPPFHEINDQIIVSSNSDYIQYLLFRTDNNVKNQLIINNKFRIDTTSNLFLLLA